MRKYLLFILALCVLWIAKAQTDIEYRYWFDGNDVDMQTGSTSQTAWSMDLDVSGLSNNMHTLYIQVKNSKGEWSSPSSRQFFKLLVADDAVCKYWFDNNVDDKYDLPILNGVSTIDVTKLVDGIHYIHIGVYNNSGEILSNIKSSLFLKLAPTEIIDKMTCLFYLDSKLYKQEDVPAGGGILHWTFDATSMTQGLHKAQILVVTPSGATSDFKTSFFYRAMTNAEKQTVKCLYSVDGDNHFTQAGQLDGNTYHFDLDLSSISDGLHRISYMLMPDNGASSKVMTQFFFKTPLGGNGITRYDYWINENVEQTRQVMLEKHTNHYSLISLLPVDKCPLRSSCFHFEITDGKPMIYAKNDLHVRFYDAASRISESTRRFVDYHVGEEVGAITPLTEASGSETCYKPEENKIVWYSIDAEIGDSIAIKTDRTCTLQIFSPTGDEVFSSQGSGSILFDGCRAFEKGTYYIALHDVTAKYGNTVSLDYQHIDKYAVLSHTPNEVGATTGYTYIDLFGNGYDKLQEATLVCGDATLASEKIEIKDISNATLCYSLDGENEARGEYDLVLKFNDEGVEETLIVEKAVSVVDPVYGDIEITIKPTRRTAKPYPVIIEVKNTGNVCYQMIPLCVAFDRPTKIDEFSALNFSIGGPDSESAEDYQSVILTDNLLDDKISGLVLPTILPELRSGESVQLQVGFIAGAHTHFDLYAWAYKPWSVAENIEMPMCEYNPIEIVSQYLPSYTDAVSDVNWGNVSNLVDDSKAVYNAWTCQSDTAFSQELLYDTDDDIRALQSPYSVLSNILRHNTQITGEELDSLENVMANIVEDVRLIPISVRIDVLMPGDPNDILGYTSPSGSKFVAKDVTDAYYTIQFENDPEIANAPAHHIVLTDTIDGRYFDLASFHPTGVKLGQKNVMLDGDQSFVTTIDLRPGINALVELKLDYDVATGIMIWDFISLDPMTMEFTDHVMSGVLPVNNDSGDGEGEVSFDINFKRNIADGTEIKNRASIVFDQEDAIMTPYWINTVDLVAPVSKATSVEAVGDTDIKINFEGTDALSGVWRYALYVQESTSAQWSEYTDTITSSPYIFKGRAGCNYGFYVVAVDSAENIEPKAPIREVEYSTCALGDANSDGSVDILDVMTAINVYLGHDVSYNKNAADTNADGTIDILDAMGIAQIYLSTETTTVQKVRQRITRITNNESN